MNPFEMHPLVIAALLIAVVTSSVATSTIMLMMSEVDDHEETSGDDIEQVDGWNANETDCRLFLEEYNRLAMDVYSDYMEKQWDYNTNITEHNQYRVVR